MRGEEFLAVADEGDRELAGSFGVPTEQVTQRQRELIARAPAVQPHPSRWNVVSYRTDQC